MRTTFTSESVTEGHPDKIADQVSDGVLDAISHKRVRRVAGRHRFRDRMGHDEQGTPGRGPVPPHAPETS